MKETLLGWLDSIVDVITGFFAFVPQLIYFLYTSAASFLDFLQYLIRKLAGLDVYYINGEPTSGDIVTSFIKGILGIDKSANYSAITTVFWSLVIFGVILLVLTTIFSIIKAHYNYDAKKSHPMTIVGQTLKSFATMCLVPFVAIFGFILCNIFLQTLDTITSPQNAAVGVFESVEKDDVDDQGNAIKVSQSVLNDIFVSGSTTPDAVEGDEDKVFSRYDFFGEGAFTSSPTFSGVLFQTAANACNRVRLGDYSVVSSKTEFEQGPWETFGAFYSTAGNEQEKREEIAQQIDYAFSHNLLLKPVEGQKYYDVDWNRGDSKILASSYMLGYSAVVGLELNYVDSMSKYNIGLVWYYYNLWAFNWIIAFAGFFAFITLLSNIVFGLITRMIMLLAMFLVFPPLIGIAPLDEGNAFKSWRQQYMKDALMCFGAIVGMNIFFIILPFFNTIQFFEFSILNQIMNVVIMLAGLTMVKKFIGLLSGFVGGSDANSVGEETKKATAELGFKAANTTLKAGGLGFSMAKGAMRGVSGVVKTPLSMIGRGVGGIASKIAGSEKVANMKKFMSQEERDKRFVGLQKFKKAGLGFRPLTDEEQAFVDKKVKNRMSRRAARKKIGNGIDKFGKGTKSLAKRGVKRTGKIVGGLGVLSTIPFGGELKRDGDGKWDISGSLAGFGQSVVKIGKDNVKFVTDDLIGMKGGFDKVKNELYKIKAIATPMGKDGIYTQNEKGEYIHKKMFNEKQKEEAANRLSQADRQNTAASAQTSKDIKNLLEEIVKNSRRTP